MSVYTGLKSNRVENQYNNFDKFMQEKWRVLIYLGVDIVFYDNHSLVRLYALSNFLYIQKRYHKTIHLINKFQEYIKQGIKLSFKYMPLNRLKTAYSSIIA